MPENYRSVGFASLPSAKEPRHPVSALPRFLVKDAVSGSFDCCPPDTHESLRRALRRVQSWCAPPNWALHDWSNETRAIAISAVLQALPAFDSSRGVPLGAFLYLRAVGGCYTRYRKEWAYATHCTVDTVQPEEFEGDDDLIQRSTHNPNYDQGLSSSSADLFADSLRIALEALPKQDRALAYRLYWERRTEAEIACELGVSQQAVSKRKRVVLSRLRAQLEASEKSSGRL